MCVIVCRCQSTVAREVLDAILSIQPKDSSGTGETRESVVYRQADEMLRKMPANYIVFEVSVVLASFDKYLSVVTVCD